MLSYSKEGRWLETKIADKSAWKPVRVKKEWLEMIREAHKKNPDFSPTFDLADASEPHLIHVRVSGRVPVNQRVGLGSSHPGY